MRTPTMATLVAIPLLAASPALAATTYTTNFNSGGQVSQSTPQDRTVSGDLPWSFGTGTFTGVAHAGPAHVNTSTRTDCNWESGLSGSFSSWTKASATTDDLIITGPGGPVHGTIHLRVSASFDGDGGFADNGAGYSGLFWFSAGSPYASAFGQVNWYKFSITTYGWLTGVTTRSFSMDIPLEANYPVNTPFSFSISTEVNAGCYGNVGYNPGWAATDGGSGGGVSLGLNGVVMDLPPGYTLNSAAWAIQNNTVGVDDEPHISRLQLRLASANPTMGEARYVLTLPQASRVQATVFDAMGRAVRLLIDGQQEQGIHEFRWDGRDENGVAAPAGLYFTRVSAMGETVALRVVRVR